MKIYDYENVSLYLKDAWKQKKISNPSFSIRAWAAMLGMKSHGPLQQMIAGKRPIPRSYIPSLCKSLNLKQREALYLEALIDFDRSRVGYGKIFYLNRLKTLRPSKNKLQATVVQNFEMIKDPIHSIIRTLVGRKDFKGSSRWIQSRLIVKRSLEEIELATQRLVTLGLLSRDENGKLSKTSSHSTNQIDTPSTAVQEFHRAISKMAAQQVSELSIEEREYNAFALNIKKGSTEEAKRRIRSFLAEFISEFEDESSDETNIVNLQFFRIAKKENEK